MTAASRYTLAQLAERFGLDVSADAGATVVTGVCALAPGVANHIAFAGDGARAAVVHGTAAAAVIVTPALAADCPVPVLIADNPRLAFARVAALFEPAGPAPGVHPSAVVEQSAQVDASASIGAQAVIGADSVIGARTVVGAGSVIEPDVQIGPDVLIASHVSIGRRSRIGAAVRIEAHAAIGGRGFGLVHNGNGWESIPQLGGVRIDDRVEIGAGTTIDRGAIEDTVIGEGVKIDDQVHIGHNCVIGTHTVIAGCTGIAGSCTIGSGCMIGGGVGIGDHVAITDGVVITAASQVPRSIDAAGVYSSTFRAMPAGRWRRRLALFRQLDRIEARLRRVEQPDKTRGG